MKIIIDSNHYIQCNLDSFILYKEKNILGYYTTLRYALIRAFEMSLSSSTSRASIDNIDKVIEDKIDRFLIGVKVIEWTKKNIQ